MSKLKRLTKAEWDIINSCMAFVDAGERDGGPLERDTDKEQKHAEDVFISAWDKVAERGSERGS